MEGSEINLYPGEWPTDAHIRPWLDPAVPLVGIQGLNELHNTITSNLPGSRQPHFLRTISLKDGHIFPKKKPRHAIEGGVYDPEGILKSNWIEKRRRIIPAAVLRVFEWNESKNFDDQDQLLFNLITKFRSDNQRDIKLLLLIIVTSSSRTAQSLLEMGVASGASSSGTSIPALTSSQLILQDRLSKVSKKAGLDGAKSIFYIFNDIVSVKPALKRLETWLIDICSARYKNEAKRIKGIKHQAGQVRLPIRHNFKVGYYFELCKDNNSALKFYRISYNFLRQYPHERTSFVALELRNVASILSYRMCRLLLLSGRPTETFEQFNNHLTSFRGAEGPSNLNFVYYGYISNQYMAFAALLDQAPVSQVPRSKQSNAGFYFQTAAAFALKRKQAATTFLSTFRPDRPPTFSPPLFVGYPSRRRSDGKEELSEALPTEEEFVKCALTEESVVNHSQQVLALLDRAHESYKREESQRMKLHVLSLLAQGYYDIQQYEMSKKLYEKIANDYREEKWWSVLADVLLKTLDSSRKILSALLSTKDSAADGNLTQASRLYKSIIECILELLSRKLSTTLDQKKVLFQELMDKILTVHQCGASLASTVPSAAREAWATILSQQYNIPEEYQLLHCASHFRAPAIPVRVKQSFLFVLQIQSFFPLPIKFSKISLSFSDSTLIILPAETTDEILVPSGGSVSARTALLPEELITYQIQFTAQQKQSLQCTEIVFDCEVESKGSEQSTTFFLKCPCGTLDVDTIQTPPTDDPNYLVFAAPDAEPPAPVEETKDAIPQTKIEQLFPCTILPPLAIISEKPRAYFVVEQAPPALKDEYHPLLLVIHSDKDQMQNATVTFTAAARGQESLGRVQEKDPEIENEEDMQDFPGEEEMSLQNEALSTSDVSPGLPSLTAPSSPMVSAQSAPSSPRSRSFAETSQAVSFFQPSSSISDQSPDSGVREVTEPLPLPLLSPGSQYQLPIYMRCSIAQDQAITATIEYQNEEGVPLTYAGSFVVPVVHPFQSKCRVFSEGTDTVQGGWDEKKETSRNERSHRPDLLVEKPCVLHVELENISGHRLRLQSITFVTNLKSFKDSRGAEGERIPQNLVLGVGDRLTLIHRCIPTKTGQARPANVLISWCSEKKNQALPKPKKEEDTKKSPSSPKSSPPDSKSEDKESGDTKVPVPGQNDDEVTDSDAPRSTSEPRPWTRSRALTMFRLKAGALLDPSQIPLSESGDPETDGVRVRDPTEAIEDLSTEFEVPAAEGKGDNDESARNFQAITPSTETIETETPIGKSEKGILEKQDDLGVSLQIPKPIFTDCKIKLPTCRIGEAPLLVTLDHVPSCDVEETFQLTVTMMNQTAQLQDIEIALDEEPSNLCISGLTHGTVRLLPLSQHQLFYRLAPLSCGYLPLPKIKIRSILYDKLLVDLNEFGSVFVFTSAVHSSN